MDDSFRKQLVDTVAAYRAAYAKSRGAPPSSTTASLQTRCIAAVERVSGKQSPYFRMVQHIQDEPGRPSLKLHRLIGVVTGLLSDLDNDYLRTLGEVLRADVFADYLEMSRHLLDSGYKDAAAVLSGSTLEVHLRKLCNKANIPIVDGNGKPRKAHVLNSELYKARVYGNLEQQSVTSWLALRNSAAHGHYSEYSEDEVRVFIAGIHGFLTRHPA